MTPEIDIEDWPVGGWEERAQQACDAAAQIEPALSNPRLSVSILFTTNAEIHRLNKEWRDKDKPTNVLSFPMLQRAELLDLASDGLPNDDLPSGGPSEMPSIFLGDIALALETCAAEAEDKNIPLAHHASHLIIHGLLHLAGHDHVDSDQQAEEMEALEIAALAKMSIANPYEAR